MIPHGPRRLWGDDFELQELLTTSPGGAALATRDLGLLTIAARLEAEFLGQVVFKGGFVLRHVHGVLRFSKDLDGTRDQPPKHKLGAEAVALAIREASIGDQIRFDPGQPATDSARSLDFDAVKISGALISDTEVQVEVSYREAIVDPPERVLIETAFYEPFELHVMRPHEMAAEKLRTLAQRSRQTDLADLAVLLDRDDVREADVVRCAVEKFRLVAKGRMNRVDRVEQNLREMAADYDDVVPAVFPDAPAYKAAIDMVLPRIRRLVPG